MCHTFVLAVELWQRRSSGAPHAENTETPKQLGKGASGENFWQPAWGPEREVSQCDVIVRNRYVFDNKFQKGRIVSIQAGRETEASCSAGVRVLLLESVSRCTETQHSHTLSCRIHIQPISPATFPLLVSISLHLSLYIPVLAWVVPLAPSLRSKLSASSESFFYVSSFAVPHRSSRRPPSPPAVKLVTGLSGVVSAAVNLRMRRR